MSWKVEMGPAGNSLCCDVLANELLRLICTLRYPIDPSIRWYLVVSEFHLIDRFQIERRYPFFWAQGHLVFWTWSRATYLSLVHSSRWTRSLFSNTSLELPIWADHIPAYLGNSFTCVQYRMCYTCPGPIFQCKCNCDVNLVIRLTKFGNFGNWYICICISVATVWRGLTLVRLPTVLPN